MLKGLLAVAKSHSISCKLTGQKSFPIFLSVEISYSTPSSFNTTSRYNNAVTYNSHKAVRWCNNHNHWYFAGNQLSKPHHLWDCHRIYNIIYQSSNCYNQQYINYHCKNNLLYYCSLCSHNSAISFLHKMIGHKPVFTSFHSQTKG